MALFAIRQTKPAIDERGERKAELERIVEKHRKLLEAVARAQAEADQQDLLIRKLDSDPIRLAEIGMEAYDAELRRRTVSRMELGRAMMALQTFAREKNVTAAMSELTEIGEAERREAMQAHHDTISEQYLEVYQKLSEAAEEYKKLLALFDEVPRKWPRNEPDVLGGLHILPPGLLSPAGPRSVLNYLGEMLAMAGVELPADDPGRRRVEQSRAEGRQHRLFFPGLIWGD